MQIIRSLDEMRTFSDKQKSLGSKIGLVPTMGALHAGHMSLIRESNVMCDITVCSIFVNPIQFNKPEDLEKYPRDEEADLAKLDSEGCAVVFIPSTEDMYPLGEKGLSMSFGKIESVMEGEFRSGHFSGVGVIILKLFHLVNPNTAFFGEKDLQQLAIIRKLVRDLNFPVEVRGVETMRESNGLAMSSRNVRFTTTQREDASQLYSGLKLLEKLLKEGSTVSKAKDNVRTFITSCEGVSMEYLELVDSESMEVISNTHSQKDLSICAAAVVHGVRIIDNISIQL